MSVRRLAEQQPGLRVHARKLAWVEEQIAKYPPGRQASAVIPPCGGRKNSTITGCRRRRSRRSPDMLGMPYIRVLEVATFYTMFNLSPVWQVLRPMCGTTPCMLRGSDAIKKSARSASATQGQVTADGLFSWLEVECLGACCNAPMVQINDDYYEDLTPEFRTTARRSRGRPPRISARRTGGCVPNRSAA